MRNAGGGGEPHLFTFDGLLYDLQAIGDFVLVRGDELELQARMERYESSETSVFTAAAARIGTHEVVFYLSAYPRLRIDGELLEPCGRDEALCTGSIELGDGGVIDYSNRAYNVKWPNSAARLRVTRPRAYELLDILIRVRPDAANISGLLGDLDDDPRNDLRTRDGELLSLEPTQQELYGRFAESWRVAQSESLFGDPGSWSAPGLAAPFVDPTFPHDVTALTPRERANGEATCRAAGILDPAWIAACALDVTVLGLERADLEADDSPIAMYRDLGPPRAVVEPSETSHADDTPRPRRSDACSCATADRGSVGLGWILVLGLFRKISQRRSRFKLNA